MPINDPKREALVWLAGVESFSAPTSAGLTAALSANERARMARFHFQRDQTAYGAAHGLLRHALSDYCPATLPADWLIGADSRGRPLLINHPLAGRLHFSLTHTAGLVACIVALDRPCGIDAEPCARAVDLDVLGPAALAAGEMALLRELAPAEQAAQFLRFWTMKEAYAKALGVGLSLPFPELDVTAGAEHTDWTLAASAGAPRAYRLAQWVDGGHWLATAVAMAPTTPVLVRRHWPPA